MYKTFEITKKTCKKSGVELMVLNGIKWLNEKHIEKGLDHTNLRALTRKYPSKYRKHRYELVDEHGKTTKQNFFT